MSAKFVGVIRPAVDRLVQARRRLRPLDPDGPAASEREQPNQTHGGDGGGPTRHRRLSRTLCVAEDGPDGDLLSWVAVGSGWRLHGAGQLRSARSGGTVAAPERGRNDHEIHAHKGRLGEAGDDGEWEADPGHGATGNTGSPLVELLAARGVPVRIMVRRQAAAARFEAASVEVAVADFDDAGSLAAALSGIGRAYLVTPSSEQAQAQQVRFAESAAAAGVEHLVVLSQFAADEASPVRFLRWHATVERRIRERGVGYTFLRPNLYFQGLL